MLAAGLQTLNELVGKAAAAAIELVTLTADAAGGTAPAFGAVYPSGWSYTAWPGGAAFQSADGQIALVYDVTTADGLAGVLAPFGISDPAANPAAVVDTYTANGVEWKIAQAMNATGFAFDSAFAEIDGKTYVITVVAPEAIVEPISETLLYGAIDAFEPNAGS